MKINNETKYQARQLRKLFAACLAQIRKHEGPSPYLKSRVRLAYARGPHVSGYAFLRSARMCIKLPGPKHFKQLIAHFSQRQSTVDVGRPRCFAAYVAAVFIHEAGHNLGYRHLGNKSHAASACGIGLTQTIENVYIDFINTITDEAFPISLGIAQKVAACAAPASLLQAKLKKASASVKRAQTALRKAERRVRYYEAAIAKETAMQKRIAAHDARRTAEVAR